MLYELADWYDADPRPHLSDELSFILSFSKGVNRCIELGCGTGRILLPLAEAGVFASGVDVSSAMLERLRQKLTVNTASRIQLFYHDARTELPVHHQELALASYNFLHHFAAPDDWSAVLRNVSRCLVDGGTFIADLTASDTSTGAPRTDFEVAHAGGTLRRRTVFLPSENGLRRRKLLFDYEHAHANRSLEVAIGLSPIYWDRLADAAHERLIARSATFGYGGASAATLSKVVAIFEKRAAFQRVAIGPSRHAEVRNLIERGNFVPKFTWDRPITDMVIEGLSQSKWSGVGLCAADGNLVSYLDFRDRGTEVEIGSCATDPRYRNKHLMSELFSELILRYWDRNITVGTYESNSAMRTVFAKFGFSQVAERADRVDGQRSLYFSRRAGSPFRW